MKRVEKPWGYELWWAQTDRYVGKLIHVNKGHALSLQYHNRKDETIFVHAGRILFELQEGDTLTKREMLPGDSVHVTPPTVHRMTAIEDSDIFEVSTPETDDVVRLEDRYGRSLRSRPLSGAIRDAWRRRSLFGRGQLEGAKYHPDCSVRGTPDRDSLPVACHSRARHADVIFGVPPSRQRQKGISSSVTAAGSFIGS
jgi:mannose-6-phosphate isomerase